MIQLLEQDRKLENRNSSKGNQLKWCREGIWYKADYTGYEGLFVKKSKKQSDFLSRNNMAIDHKYCTFLRSAKKCNIFIPIFIRFFATIFNSLTNILNFFRKFFML